MANPTKDGWIEKAIKVKNRSDKRDAITSLEAYIARKYPDVGRITVIEISLYENDSSNDSFYGDKDALSYFKNIFGI